MAKYDKFLKVLSRVESLSYDESKAILLEDYYDKTAVSRALGNLEERGKIVRFRRNGTRIRLAYFDIMAPRPGKVYDMPMHVESAMALLRFTIHLARQHYDHPNRLEMMKAIREVMTYLEPFIEALNILVMISQRGASKAQYEQLSIDMKNNGWMKGDYESFDKFHLALQMLWGIKNEKIPDTYARLDNEFWTKLWKMGGE